jgi:cullin 1
MTLFKYIEDKDVFQTFYTTKLSKRLIHGVSASDESEASMIAKLKEACGFEYTNKLQRMFTDMQLSKDLTDQFKERMEVSHDAAELDVAFSAMVLGTNFWPLNAPAHNFNIPKNILPTYERFQRYYQSKHSGRKLTWLWNYSKNELRTNYLNQKYILMTSSYQMAVLVQYNENDTLSLDELVTATGIPKDLLSQVLAVLVKAKILINEETEQYDLNPSECYCILVCTPTQSIPSIDFKSKKVILSVEPIRFTLNTHSLRFASI